MRAHLSVRPRRVAEALSGGGARGTSRQRLPKFRKNLWGDPWRRM